MNLVTHCVSLEAKGKSNSLLVCRHQNEFILVLCASGIGVVEIDWRLNFSLATIRAKDATGEH